MDDSSRILYVSQALDGIDATEIDRIVKVSRDFNASHSITGLLLYSGTHFAQLLEGPDSVLESLMDSIRRDARHREVRTLLQEPLARRDFDGWAMAFVEEHGVSDLLESIWAAPKVSVSRSQRLISKVFLRFSPPAGT